MSKKKYYKPKAKLVATKQVPKNWFCKFLVWLTKGFSKGVFKTFKEWILKKCTKAVPVTPTKVSTGGGSTSTSKVSSKPTDVKQT
ncbi:MAG: hypothetical protein ACTSQF_01935 [Candidatus Heimdallarchaeaceae archaeon]